MGTINLVFKLVNNLKYYLEIDGVMVFPPKHQSEYCMSRFLAYLLFRIFVGVLVLIYRWAIIHVYNSIIAILLYFDDMIDIK